MSTTSFAPALLRKYDQPGPRYTSYPTAPQFSSAYGAGDFQAELEAAAGRSGPLSVYAHLPFCQAPCYYCGCSKIISTRLGTAAAYLEYLLREIGMHGKSLGHQRPVEQLHFGGGTPTYYPVAQLARIVEAIEQAFTLAPAPGREFSIEIDPRSVEPESLDALARLGFNRASFGIQDFDPAVQAAVNRRQSREQVEHLMEAARAAGFVSVSVDLIYGLPLQTPGSFADTLEQVIALRPDRISAYGYAHVPHLFKAQGRIRLQDLPDAATRLQLLQLTVEQLTANGYVYIGMDHFALPGDELARSLADGSLQRNFQGYSTRGGLDLLGLGMSAISRIGNSYAQNARKLSAYRQAIDEESIPVERGLRLSRDDLARRDVIAALMCGGSLEFAGIEAHHGLEFNEYFRAELDALRSLRDDGLVELGDHHLRVLPAGRYLLRTIAMTFDAYLHKPRGEVATLPRYSRVI